METERAVSPQWVDAETTVYVTTTAAEPPAWLAGWLQGRGVPDVREAASTTTLLRLVRDWQRERGARRALALVAADSLDEDVLALCRPLQRLGEEGWFGFVLLLEGGVAPAAAALRAAAAAGCIDVVHVDGRQPGGELQTRLLLAAQVVRERHLRISREQMFQTQLAQRRVMEARLSYVASHDELTDLANRRGFEKALDLAIALGARRQFTNALLYLDLDRFKLHNDAAGHGSGDYLLQVVGNLLRGALPPEYLLARLGSDEFAVLVQGTDEEEALQTAERLRAAVAALEPDGVRIVYHVGISIGVALMRPGSVSGASQALAQAEQACYVAKTCGGNTVHRFRAEDEALEQLREDMRWALPIRRALAENRFFLAFQPILSVAEASVSHYEALIRIPSSAGGDGQSARFMLAAERLGLARQIDLWVVSSAIDFLAANGGISLGVNLSSHAFQEAALLPLLRDKLEATAIAPERITFEITETAAVMNFVETRRMITELRDFGCRFALDDFGSGFSSYSYLKQFPIDMLKIDGSFIVGVRQDRRDQAIVQSMVDIGHSLDKDVVAEFIEDEETFALLVEMGIDFAQGHLIGRPTVNPTPRPPARKGEEAP